ncbi:c-type cytochrome [Occallatibacter savannae]|uniref:c-type cytochrome n=1 Tax=Occallatibacter savannae TaxID=1002691 RepID=UPI00194E48E7|nr:cytochrome c [Occallatibacter savannae]
MVKSFAYFAAVVLLVVAAVSAPARPPQESSQPSAGKKAGGESMAKAKKVYELDCALCHGAAGDGKSDLAKDMSLNLLDWTDPKSLSGKSDQDLFNAIRKGSGKMPPEDAARAKDDEVRNLVQYIRKFAKNQSAAPAAAPAAEPAPAPAEAPAAAPATAPAPSR